MARKKLFISYPHQPERCVHKVILGLKEMLVNNGYDVWLDERLKTGHDWRLEITKGLQESQCVLVFLSEHSTRKDSICLDEIAMAVRICPNEILSVQLEPEAMIKVPLILRRIQLLNMEDWEAKFQADNGGPAWQAWLDECTKELISGFARKAEVFEKSGIDVLQEVLKPDQYWAKIARHLDGFVGREWIVQDVVNRLKDPDGPRLLWLYGGPGMGKTSIAARLAHDLELPAAGIYFCRFDRKRTHSAEKVLRTLSFQMANTIPAYRHMLLSQLSLTPESSITKILSAEQELSKLSAGELFKKLLSDPVHIGGEPLLLILDGLDEISTEGNRNEIAELLAGQEFKHLHKWLRVLVTSRPDALLREILSGVASAQIDAQSDDNLSDLRLFLEQQICLGEGEARDLAINTLLARSEGVFIYASTVIEAIRNGIVAPGQPDLFPAGLKGLYRQYLDRSYPADGKLFEVSARPLLELIIASPEPLPVATALSVLDCSNYYLVNFCTAMGSLIDQELLESEKKLSFFHRSFAEWLVVATAPYQVDQGNGGSQLTKWLWNNYLSNGTIALDGYAAQALPSLLSDLTERQRRGVFGAPSSAILDCIDQAAREMEHRYRYRQAIQLQQVQLSEVKSYHGATSLETAQSITRLADMCANSSRVGESVPLYRQALAILETLTSRGLETATGLINLADALSAYDRNPEAECLYLRALDIFDQRYPGSTAEQKHAACSAYDRETNRFNLCEIARCQNNLANWYVRTDRSAEAEPLYRSALSIREQCSDPLVSTSLYNFAYFLKVTGCLEEAEHYFRRALDINEQQAGPYTPEVILCLLDLAGLLMDTDRLPEADALSNRALALCEQIFEPDHLLTSRTLRTRSRVLVKFGRMAEAESFSRRVLAISEQTLAPGNPDIATYLADLARICHTTKGFTEAEALLLRALAIREQCPESDSTDLAATLFDLAVLHTKENHFKEAEQYFLRAVAIRKLGLIPYSLTDATNLMWFASLLSTNQRWIEAESLYRQCLDIYERNRNFSQSPLALCLSNLAEMLVQTERTKEAESHYRRSLSICMEHFDPLSLQTARVQYKLATLLVKENRIAEAVPLCRDASAIIKQNANAALEKKLSQLALVIAQKMHQGRSAVPAPERSRKVGRNDPCTCGSGIKFKKCCG